MFDMGANAADDVDVDVMMILVQGSWIITAWDHGWNLRKARREKMNKDMMSGVLFFICPFSFTPLFHLALFYLPFFIWPLFYLAFLIIPMCEKMIEDMLLAQF